MLVRGKGAALVGVPCVIRGPEHFSSQHGSEEVIPAILVQRIFEVTRLILLHRDTW